MSDIKYWVSMFLLETSPGINKGYLPNTPLLPGNTSTKRNMYIQLMPGNASTRRKMDIQLIPRNTSTMKNIDTQMML